MSQFKNTLNKKAVALKYDDAKNRSPVIVASGMGYMAEKIVEAANENGVPVYEDNSLATILTQLELGSQVPEELYQAIVDIYLYFLDFAPGTEKEKIMTVEEELIETEEEEILK
ncbi:EscU/YscU/HrcU family type III secretion system export apparatus switch protein [Clostridium sp. E02]|uniref:EscU/YscU/HrcU family type III secretion system export apparatus switch protein n=1 Tax=Clostridium sp. E02 TaxID=2487134 RepID=UPI000F52B8EB|nr:EscU/YscU/HrcU family type III secretion system export apparatus switch protein [Clostridium sp. E02]